MIVPFVDLAAQGREIEGEFWPELQELFRNGEFIGGKTVTLFEQAYAEFLGTGYCVGVRDGTDTLELALRAGGVTRSSEVILPVGTFIATAEALLRIGSTPVFVDVDETHLLIDPQRRESAVTDRTSATIPFHLYGQVAPVEAIEPIARRVGARIVEDAAERYEQMLRGIEGMVRPTTMTGNVDVWHLYVVRVPGRDTVLRRLQDAGIGAGIHYPQPLHRTPALKGVRTRHGGYPVAERAARQLISLPLHAHISEKTTTGHRDAGSRAQRRCALIRRPSARHTSAERGAVVTR
jgi:dTDP-4-amino-4,6-dideoxygalactose transaminase